MAKSTSGNKTVSFYSWDSGGRTTDFDIVNYHLAGGKQGSGIATGTGTRVGTDWTRVTNVIVCYNSFTPNIAMVTERSLSGNLKKMVNMILPLSRSTKTSLQGTI